MLKKNDVFRFADADYLIQKVEETVVRVTKIVNGKPQRGRPTKMDRGLVEKLVGETLEVTVEVETPKPASVAPIPELTEEEKRLKREKTSALINSIPDFDEADEDIDIEEPSVSETSELSSLFGEA